MDTRIIAALIGGVAVIVAAIINNMPHKTNQVIPTTPTVVIQQLSHQPIGNNSSYPSRDRILTPTEPIKKIKI
ncbi:hypothetical protein TI03_03640 [Achromatium sp. WMS1]|nr:hypothetical protein TI03_03640 [Achromatium sp. WMS1]